MMVMMEAFATLQRRLVRRRFVHGAAGGSGLRRSGRRYVVAGHGHGWSVLWVLDVRKPRQGRVNTAQGG